MLTDFYNLRPDELKPGMVFACIVTCHIDYLGNPRLYRCAYPNAEVHDGVPQGSPFYENTDEVVAALFPVVRWAKEGE